MSPPLSPSPQPPVIHTYTSHDLSTHQCRSKHKVGGSLAPSRSATESASSSPAVHGGTRNPAEEGKGRQQSTITGCQWSCHVRGTWYCLTNVIRTSTATGMRCDFSTGILSHAPRRPLSRHSFKEAATRKYKLTHTHTHTTPDLHTF